MNIHVSKKALKGMVFKFGKEDRKLVLNGYEEKYLGVDRCVNCNLEKLEKGSILELDSIKLSKCSCSNNYEPSISLKIEMDEIENVKII